MSSNHGQLKRDYIGNTLMINNKLIVDRQTNICGKNGKFNGDVKIKGDLCVEGSINEHVAGTFDVIVAGVGTAGCVAFRRISDGDPTLSVLGLTTGGYINDDPVSKYPFYPSDPEFGQINLFQSVTGGTTSHTDSIVTYNWLSYAINKNTANIYAGRGMGGAGMHNFLFAIRGSPGFHNYVSTFAGAYAAQWNSTALNTIYQNIETYIGPPAQPNRGYSGPVQVLQTPPPPNTVYGDSIGDFLDSFASQSLAAADQALSVTLDFNGNQELAMCKSDQNFLYPDGESPIGVSRASSASGYMGPDFITTQGFSAIGRNNRMIFEAYVDSIIFDEDLNAVGVKAVVNGECKVYKANKKVIICAGTMRSPGILERSGIGAGSRLSAIGITQLVENPNVGENFQTHAAPGGLFEWDEDANPLTAFVANLQAVVSTPFPYNRVVEYYFPTTGNAQGYLQAGCSFGANFSQFFDIGIPLDGRNLQVFFALMAQTTSVGSVHITHKNVDTQPKWIWNINSIEDAYVLRTAYQHLKRTELDLQANHPTMGLVLHFPIVSQYAGYPNTVDIGFTASIAANVMTVTAVASGTLQSTMSVLEGAGWSTAPASVVLQGTMILNQIYPLLFGETRGGIGRYALNKSMTVGSMSMHGDYLDQAAGSLNIVQAHPSGTCRMGDRVTQQGVVDGQLHVYGVQRLMVADNSIWPQIPDGNTAWASMAAGYRAADICLATI